MADSEILSYRDPDPFQEFWKDPDAHHALYVDAEHGFMVIPDERPVRPNHLMVVAREHRSLEEMDLARQQAMWGLVMLTYQHISEVLQPARKVLVAVWGNQVRTAHIHLVPRETKEDATVWAGTPATEAQLEATRQLLAFPPELQQRAVAHIGDILNRMTA